MAHGCPAISAVGSSVARGGQIPNTLREFAAALRVRHDAVTLDLQRRQIVEKTIADHCAIRKWTLHAMSCRTNHVHIVVEASGRSIEIPREQFKAWCTRKLDEFERSQISNGLRLLREEWWTERGWDEYIDTERALAEVKTYVHEGQTD